MKRTFIFMAATLALTASLDAAIINVPADQATIQAAVDAAMPTGDEIVVAPGTYTGSVEVLGKSLIIRGSDPGNRPIVVLEPVGTPTGPGFSGTGIILATDNGTFTISDLILIPSTTSTPDRAIQTSTENSTDINTLVSVTVAIDNILITGNNGSDAPSATDPLDLITPLGTTYGSDGMYLVNRAFLGSLRDGTGIYTITDTTVIGAGRDGIVAYPASNAPTTGGSVDLSGVAISRSTRNYLQIGGSNLQDSDFTVTGSRANPGLLITGHTAGSGNTVEGINDAGDVNIDNLVYLNNTRPFNISAPSTASVSITDSLIANTTGDDGLAFQGGGANTPVITISGNTFYNNGEEGSNTAVLWLQDTTVTYNVSQNIFAGTNLQGVLVLNTGVGAQVTLTDNAFALAGPDALNVGVFGGGAPAASETGTVTADPEFSSTAINSIADLATAFDVMGASYAPGSISGYGALNVVVSSSENWNLYQ